MAVAKLKYLVFALLIFALPVMAGPTINGMWLWGGSGVLAHSYTRLSADPSGKVYFWISVPYAFCPFCAVQYDVCYKIDIKNTTQIDQLATAIVQQAASSGQEAYGATMTLDEYFTMWSASISTPMTETDRAWCSHRE